MTIPYSTNNSAGFNFRETFTPPAAGSYNTGQLAPVALGQKATGTDGSEWVYVVAGTGGVTGLGYVVVIDENWTCLMMSNSVGAFGDKIGVAPVAAALGDYLWVQLFGTCDDIRVTASTGANVALASTVTNGQISATVTTPTKNLPGIILTTARGGTDGNAPGFLNWPVVGTTN